MIFTAVKFVAGSLAGIGAGAVATKAFATLAANVMPETSRFMKVAITLGGIGVGMAVTDVTTKAIEEAVDNTQQSFENIKELAVGIRKGVKNAKTEETKDSE